MKNALSILGVSPFATPRELKLAHRKLVVLHHPDKARDEATRLQSTQVLTQVNAAFDYIRTPEGAAAMSTARKEALAAQNAASPLSAGFAAERPSAFIRPFGRSQRAHKEPENWVNDFEKNRAAWMAKHAEEPSKEDLHREKLRDDAFNDIRTRLREEAANSGHSEPLRGETLSIFGKARHDTAFTMTKKQTELMDEKLSHQAKLEATSRIRAARGGDNAAVEDSTIPTMHKAQKIAFEGRVVKVQLGSRGVAGRNFVALPEMIQTKDNDIRIGRGAQLFELRLDRDGKQVIDPGNDQLVKNARGIAVKIEFSEQREQMRSSAMKPEQCH